MCGLLVSGVECVFIYFGLTQRNGDRLQGATDRVLRMKKIFISQKVLEVGREDTPLCGLLKGWDETE